MINLLVSISASRLGHHPLHILPKLLMMHLLPSIQLYPLSPYILLLYWTDRILDYTCWWRCRVYLMVVMLGEKKCSSCALVEWLSQNCSFLPLIQLYPLSIYILFLHWADPILDSGCWLRCYVYLMVLSVDVGGEEVLWIHSFDQMFCASSSLLSCASTSVPVPLYTLYVYLI